MGKGITRKDLRDFIASIGGEDVVCARLGRSVRTLNSYLDRRALSSRWYGALREMAREHGVAEPPMAFFDMLPDNAKGRKRVAGRSS